MNDEKKNIDQLLNQAFTGFEPAVPPGVWNNIEQGLTKKKRRIAFWWSAAALLFIGGSAAFIYLNSTKNKSELKNTIDLKDQYSIGEKDTKKSNEIVNLNEKESDNSTSSITNTTSPSAGANNTTPIKSTNSVKIITDSKEKVTADVTEPNIIINNEFEKFELNSKDAFVTLINQPLETLIPIDFNNKPKKAISYESKWQVGAFVSSGVGFRALGINSAFANYVNKNYLQIRKDGETGRMNNNFGLLINRKLNSVLSIESGFSLSQSGFTQNYDYKINEVAVPDETKPMIQGNYPIIGYLTLSNPKAVSLKSNSNFIYLGLPLMLNSTLYKNNSNSIQLLVGTSLNVLLQQSGQTININSLELSNKQKAADLNTMALNGRLAIRYSKAISPFFNFGMEAGYTRFLQNQYKGQSIINQKPYQSGVNAMLTYNIYKTVIRKKD